MKLAGDLADFSLADLVQVTGVAGRICCIRVMAAEGNAALYLNGGEVTGVTFENLTGRDAFVALVAARAGHFQVEDGAVPSQPTALGAVQKLLLEANARIDSGEVPRPMRRPAAAPSAMSRRATPAARPAGGERRGPSLWIGGGIAAVLLLGAVSWLALARHDVAVRNGDGGPGEPGARPGATAGASSAPGEPVEPTLEAAQLTAPGDVEPVFAGGQLPAAPDPAATLKPTIVCRLRVDSDGRVSDAKVYRSRLDMQAYEDAAIDAARQFHFTPARHAGKPVAVWINWPVTFR